MTTATETLKNILTQRKYSERTIESYVSWTDQFEKFYPHREISDLTGEEINSFFRHLSKMRNLSTQSARQASSAISFYYREVLNDKEKLATIPKFKLERPKPSIPSQQEIFLILSHVKNKQYATALKCIYGMGLELGEALNLKIKDIDFTTNLVNITIQRTRAQRKTPIPIFAQEELKELCQRDQKEFVFQSTSGKACDEKALQRAWNSAKKIANIEEQYTLRSLRHAYIKHMEFLGIPLKDVLEHLKMDKTRSIDYYASLNTEVVPITFSPSDRLITEEQEQHINDTSSYISEDRISAIIKTKNTNFDLIRLISLLREINIAHRNCCYMSIAMLCRATIDHIPPLLGCKTFSEVSNNYSGSKSFKKSMEHLNISLRNIADSHLHIPIRKDEALPTFMQVDFRSDMDHLLSEIIRINKAER